MKKILLLVLLAAAGAGGGYLWQQQATAHDDGTRVYYGNVDVRQVSLAFDGQGRVTALHAEEGDRVRAGERLGELDTRTLALQAAQAEAQIEVQQETLRRLRNGARPQEIAQARSRVSAADTEATQAQKDFNRVQGVFDKTQGGAISAQDVERARSAVQVARARVAEQREALRLLEAGTRVEDIAAAEAQLRALEAQLALLHHQIAQGELIAPVDAVVRARLLEPGDMATPQHAAFTLALEQPKWVRIWLVEPDLGHIRPGMTATVTTDSHPDAPFTGQVGYISSVAEFTPKAVQTPELRTSLVYEARVVIEDGADRLRLGQPATVRFSIAPLANETAAPATASPDTTPPPARQ